VSSELFFKNIETRQPNFYLEEVLKRSECPVMLVPENFSIPQQVVLSYDSGESATFAIKQFAYLFPELGKKETVLVSMSEGIAEDLPEYAMVTELLTHHYPDLRIENLPGKGRQQFVDWLSTQPDSFVVMGAFSRSALSTLFKKSFATNVIHDIKMPLFISHK
jgi:hypothetical protein